MKKVKLKKVKCKKSFWLFKVGEIYTLREGNSASNFYVENMNEEGISTFGKLFYDIPATNTWAYPEFQNYFIDVREERRLKIKKINARQASNMDNE